MKGHRIGGRKPIGRRFNLPVLLGVFSFCLICGTLSAVKLHLSVKTGLKYDPVALHVHPGEEVELLFDNVDEMMHNFALVAPGARMEVVEAAIALGSDGPARHYVPDSPKVLAFSPVVLPGKKAIVKFDAPTKEGEYPYVCTFPGHGFVMFGTLFVARERPKEMDLVLAKAASEAAPEINFSDPANSATAIVHRTFMPNSSPAAIAVSLPGGHSYCWDAGNCRLRYVWRDGFIKKNGTFGRWRTLAAIEGRIYHHELEFPFRFANRKDKPTATSFQGYRLVGGIPEFRYQADDAEITEFLAKLPGKSGLTRRFTIKNAPADLLYRLDPDAGVETTCDKGIVKDGVIRLTPSEAKDFTITLREIPGKGPVL
ncbi:MAG: plastocyanin/azurin family copper-binding protein, partial [Opitutales bacterium]